MTTFDPPTFSDLWPDIRKSKEDWMAEIEEIIEKGESCATFIFDQISLGHHSIERYLREMDSLGIIQKSRRMNVGGRMTSMYVIATENPKQQTLIAEPASRDWLVAAFFGEYKPCD